MTSQEDGENTATAEPQVDAGSGETGAEEPKRKLDLTVEITTTGPCKRRVSIEIPHTEVEHQFQDSLKEVRKDAAVPGFRPGRAPTALVQRRYRKELAGQVKSALLLAAMQQLDEEYKLNAISQPDFDLDAVEMPDDGPMKFQFELEVEPEFELPEYKGMTLNRPSKSVSEADIDKQLQTFLERYAQMVPKEGPAEMSDYVTADLTFQKDGVIFNQAKEVQFRLLPELRFQDGNIPDLSALVGAKPGDVCEVDAKVGSASQDAAIRGQNIKIVFHVHDLKRLRLPELDCEFLDRIGFDDVADLRRGLEALLRRRFEFAQYQELRRQIVEKLVEKVPFELPPELVARQEETTLRRHIEEMRQGGMSENDIRARRAQIRANAHEQTLLSLKEYFLLAKIAEAEGIKVNDEDIEDEVELIASRTDESPRRVRARIRNEGLVDALSQQILERKTLDRIIELAQVTDVAMAQDKAVETLDEVASPQTEPTSSAAETESQTSESGEAP